MLNFCSVQIADVYSEATLFSVPMFLAIIDIKNLEEERKVEGKQVVV